MNNIAIISFSAADKREAAKELSQKLGFEYIDTDENIEEKAGMSIYKMCEENGVDYYREREKETLISIAKMQNIVLSLGENAVLSEENREILLNNFIVFFLEVSNSEIKPEESADFLHKLPLYVHAADYIVSLKDKSPEEAVSEISELLDKLKADIEEGRSKF